MISRIRGALWALALVALCGLPLTAQDAWQGSQRLDTVIEQAVEDGTIPGAVLLVGRDGEIVHRKAYGSRSVVPLREAMTLDTIFDCASLTKVVVTAPAVMMLVEEGKLRLDDRVTKFLPGFAGGNSSITVRQLLTHFSGLRPDLDLEPPWSGYQTGIERAYREVEQASPGSRFVYSDINYILLAELVRQVSGRPLEELAAERIFEPLAMTESRFRPPKEWLQRIAPTERLADGTVLRGVVHDPTTRFMGGVSGHAGLFSTADDLSRFARMMLAGGELNGATVLSPLSVVAMTTPQGPPNQPVVRGLGWDLESPYDSPRGDLFPLGSYGHTGFTGTSLWLDPLTRSYVILLTNRVHPTTRTSIVSLRSRVASVVAASLTDVDVDRARLASLWHGGHAEKAGRAGPERSASGRVLTGLDVLAREGFQPLVGKRVGLITNQTGIDRQGRRNVDLLAGAPGVRLEAIFSPEHGADGRLETAEIGDSVDAATGVRVYSLYQQERRRPSEEMLREIDVLVFDIQDIGTRFYTYATTLGYAMEAAAGLQIPVYVLDRPNPIGGTVVEGPLLEEGYRSFIGYFPMPVRHGMTIGELAGMFNQERKIGARLTVVRLEGWRRSDWFDETGLPWVNPSPNIRTLQQALLYPGIGLLEGLTNYSVGRGTDTPFEFIGADWMRGGELADYLKPRLPAGAGLYAVRRKPDRSAFAGREIEGLQLTVLDRDALRPTRLGLEIATALVDLYPGRMRLEQTAGLIGNEATLQSLKGGESAAAIWARWEAEKQAFLAIRARYLLY